MVSRGRADLLRLGRLLDESAAISRDLLNLDTVRMNGSWPSRVIQTLVACS